jgi:hypothetical protein
MDIKVAEALSLLMMRVNSNLNDSIALVRDRCDPEDLRWYRREAGKVMGALLDLEEKLWTEHPALRPCEMKGSYVVDPSNFESRFYETQSDSEGDV